MKLAIIGAGVAAGAASWRLRDTDLVISVFEKSRGASGRAATRRRDAFTYDHGANFVRPTSDRIFSLITKHLPTGGLCSISRPVFTFDATGHIACGTQVDNATPTWTYRAGISALGKLLFEASGARMYYETRVGDLTRRSDGWSLTTTEGTPYGPFDAVLVTPPAPQAADLIEASSMSVGLRKRIVSALREARYRKQLSFALAFDRSIPRPADCYALVNTDRKHDVAWLSFEEDKPGHVPPNHSLLVVQMAPAWSTAHFDHDLALLVPETLRLAGSLLRTDLPLPIWSDLQRWRYALPDLPADAATLLTGEEDGLFFAGDALVGKGSVALALENGLDVAARIEAMLS